MVLNEMEGVRYELLTKDALNETAVMTAEAFACYDPVMTSLGIPSSDFAEFVRLLGPRAEEELTVIATDLESGQIIGAMITDDFAINPPAEIKQLGEKFEPVWALLDELDAQYKRRRILPTGKYLHFFLLAVDHQYSGRHVAQNLVQVCLENGVKKSYKVGVVEATSCVSQHIFRKFGFVDRFEVPYQTFAHQGRLVFESIKGHHGIILMDKALV
jgi:ribosomal protein S18 acetylase RimI-like enzyme